MKSGKSIFVKAGLLTAGGILSALALTPSAHATPVQLGFNGMGSNGHVSLAVVTDTTPGDPAGAQLVAGAKGTFSDATLGISNVPITGVLARNFATPADVLDGHWQPGDVPFPVSFSELAVSGPSVVTYDDLFYPGGAPQTCWDYPFAGGLLDGYGLMFALGNGDYVDLWGDGSLFVPTSTPVWSTYGFAVMTWNAGTGEYVISDYQFRGVHAAVPEPDFMWLLGAGVLGLFAWRRSAEARKRTSQRV